MRHLTIGASFAAGTAVGLAMFPVVYVLAARRIVRAR